MNRDLTSSEEADGIARVLDLGKHTFVSLDVAPVVIKERVCWNTGNKMWYEDGMYLTDIDEAVCSEHAVLQLGIVYYNGL